jgi:tRNA threonylcarbamoyladenosine biosynthesis protein TsaB
MNVRFQTVYNEWPTMLVLALDTTTREGSLALCRDGRLLECWRGDASLTHARRLPGDILEGLGRQGLTLADIDLFAVAAGPGSFTGLRIGIATVQGLAFAHQRLVVGVSALDALAYAALDPGATERAGTSAPGAGPAGAEGVPDRIGSWVDAQRQEVFACLYERIASGGGRPSEGEPTAADLGDLRIVAGPVVGPPADVIAGPGWREGSDITFTGDGAVRYRNLIEESATSRPAALIERVPPLAPAICEIAVRRAARGLATAPHAVRPVYIRRPDAELARGRRWAEPRDGRDGTR